jgi:hypothetical protein
MINSHLANITRKLVYLRNEHDQLSETKSKHAGSLHRKIVRLAQKQTRLPPVLTDKAIGERKKTRIEASEKCNVIRGRVREIEKKNMAQFSRMKEVGNELQDRHAHLSQRTLTLSGRLDQHVVRHKHLSNDGPARIAKLEEQLNAVISAVTAIEEYPESEELHILERVVAALGEHGASARSVEQLHREIHGMGERLEELANDGKCM